MRLVVASLHAHRWLAQSEALWDFYCASWSVVDACACFHLSCVATAVCGFEASHFSSASSNTISTFISGHMAQVKTGGPSIKHLFLACYQGSPSGLLISQAPWWSFMSFRVRAVAQPLQRRAMWILLPQIGQGNSENPGLKISCSPPLKWAAATTDDMIVVLVLVGRRVKSSA